MTNKVFEMKIKIDRSAFDLTKEKAVRIWDVEYAWRYFTDEAIKKGHTETAKVLENHMEVG